MDIRNAYLNADIDCIIYMHQPPGFEVTSNTGEELVCLVHKCLYGLKQSGRNWNKLLTDILLKFGFEQSQTDPCLFIYWPDRNNDRYIILIVYVNDILIGTLMDTTRDKFITVMQGHF